MTNIKMKFKIGLFLTLSMSMSVPVSQSAEANFEYPELSVVPLASERVDAEAMGERDRALQTQLPYLVPASASFLAGAVLLATGTKSDFNHDESGKAAAWVGMGVGAAWWGLTLGVLNHLDPYSQGSGTLSKLPAKNQREKLARERRAEEVIFQAGGLSRKLRWISIATNLFASAFMVGSSKDNNASRYVATASLVAAFTPLLFAHHWDTVECQQRDYKRRIYAPVLGAALLPNPRGSEFSPGLTLALQF
ncbi:MAG: hypothetical protein H7333_04060 [Bdellovibrionales bacterium]|nr:hypothetical protein [Oligoflexia bacterium]